MNTFYLTIKSMHIIAMVCWFAALFYLPRLYVYHSLSTDKKSLERFCVMERKLYRGIMTPSMIATWICGIILAYMMWPAFGHSKWLHIKISLVLLLTVYHFFCGFYLKKIYTNPQFKSDKFWRIFNELPVFILIIVVFLVIFKPV